MLRYKCYICDKRVESGLDLSDTIYIPEENGKDVEYQVCPDCSKKFLKRLANAKKDIFQEMMNNV